VRPYRKSGKNDGNDAEAICEAVSGLVPRQYSTGGKSRLGHITKRGDAYLRTLLILGARSTLRTAAKRADRLARWAISVKQRRGYHRACVAIAAKNARIIWALLARNEPLRLATA
jgi:transposase